MSFSYSRNTNDNFSSPTDGFRGLAPEQSFCFFSLQKYVRDMTALVI